MTTPAGSGVTNKGTEYQDGSQVTSTNLNDIVDDAVFNNNAVDGVTLGLNSSSPKALFVNNQGIDTAQLKDNAVTTVKITDANVTTAKIADDNVTTAKIADSNVTKAKIENVADMKVLGNTSGSATAPQEVSILDEDDMSSNSATAVATQQSIKAYVDTFSSAPAIVTTFTARNGESQRYFKNLSEVTDPNSIISINSGQEIQFASTGTYLVKAGVNIDDNDGTSGDYYYAVLVPTHGSTSAISFGGASMYSFPENQTSGVSHTFMFAYVVSNTTNDRLAIYAQPESGAAATSWEGAAVVEITKIV